MFIRLATVDKHKLINNELRKNEMPAQGCFTTDKAFVTGEFFTVLKDSFIVLLFALFS